MNFPAVLGQRRAALFLARFLETGRVPSAMLFAGMEGVGKTLMAREWARALLCARRGETACGSCSSCLSVEKGLHPDLRFVGTAYQASLREEEAAKQKTLRVETIRHLRKDMEMRPMLGAWKMAVLEDAHTLEIEAANALLKILEEPTQNSVWILVSSQKERVLPTIASRCFAVPFAPLSSTIVRGILEQRGVPGDRAERLAQICEGSAGRALALEPRLDELLTLAQNPAGALAASENLPRELYLARTEVESALYGLAQSLRLKRLAGDPSDVQSALSRLARLRRALSSNADPKLVMILAGEAVG